MIRKGIIMLIIFTSLFSCKTSRDLPTVETVNIQKYAGLWYEIARLPNRFEKGLECVTAMYTLKENGKIEVVNKGHLSKDNARMKESKGTAWVPDPEYQGRLEVRFFWPFAGDYYIIALDKDYNYALVGAPSRKYLWVLSRTKNLDHNIYSTLLDIAKTMDLTLKM